MTIDAESGHRRSFSIRSVLTAFVFVALAAGTVVAIADHYHPENTSQQPTNTPADLRALSDFKMPNTFQRVYSTWSCASNEQSICFNSSLDGPDAVRTLTAQVGAKTYTTILGNKVFPARYTVCTTIGSEPAAIVISGRPSNAVLQSGSWIVPDGQTPTFKGSTVNIFLTGPGNCP